MYNTLKKLSLTFILLNVFTFQSLMADMIFYYNAAILPSIIASQQNDVDPVATHNELNMTTVGIVPATIDVMADDIITPGQQGTILLKGWNNNTQQQEWSASVNTNEGNWLVEANQSVTFIPNQNFGGGNTCLDYQLSDEQGRTSEAGVCIIYTLYVQANHDNKSESDTSHTAIIDVLNNDENISSVTVSLETYGQSGPEYYDTVITDEGTWHVEANKSVTFTPAGNFGGGNVHIQYKIEDGAGHISITGINISYPVVLSADDIAVAQEIIEDVVVDVSNHVDGSFTDIKLVEYDQNQNPIYGINFEHHDGTWSIDESGMINFSPVPNFGGGSVGITYQVEDDIGHTSTANISINFTLYVRANYDDASANNAGDIVILDVLGNDDLGDGVTTPTVMLANYNNGQPEPNWIETVILNEGSWSVEANQSVKFTPSANFSGRYVHMEYRLSDGVGHFSKAGIQIEYPTDLYAEYDREEGLGVIIPVTVDVLNNDYNTSAITDLSFKVHNWQTNTTEYPYAIEVFEGNWTIVANEVTFTPNSHFAGGNVRQTYQITDDQGRTSSTDVEIVYTEYLFAEQDQVEAIQVEAMTVNVLNNDRNASPVTVQLIDVDTNTGTETPLNTYQGTWSVVDNEVLFSPNMDFVGGNALAKYQIFDAAGHISQNNITIIYPLAASSVCTATSLTTLDEILSAISSSMVNDGGSWMSFEAALWVSEYNIPSSLFTNTSVIEPSLNPMYFIEYEDNQVDNRAKLRVTEIAQFDSNSTWTYFGEKVRNENGWKSIESEGGEGNYTVELDNSFLFTVDGGMPVYNYKPVQALTYTEIGTMLSNNGIDLTLDSADTAQLNLNSAASSRYWWNNWSDNNFGPYNNLNEFISAKAYVTDTPYSGGVLYNNSGQQASITFAEGSSGTSGTLIEVSYQDGSVLTYTAGTWEIKTITDSESEEIFAILIVDPILCGYQRRLYKLDSNGYIIYGDYDELEGEVDAEIAYSESLKTKLQAYFIQKANDDLGLDVDPSIPDHIEITEAMLSANTFYDRNTELDGSGCFASMSFDSTITRHEMCYDTEGTLTSDDTFPIPYELIDGKLRADAGDDYKWFILKIDTATEWHLAEEEDLGKDGTIDHVGQSTWYKSKPAGYPDDF